MSFKGKDATFKFMEFLGSTGQMRAIGAACPEEVNTEASIQAGKEFSVTPPTYETDERSATSMRKWRSILRIGLPVVVTGMLSSCAVTAEPVAYNAAYPYPYDCDSDVYPYVCHSPVGVGVWGGGWWGDRGGHRWGHDWHGGGWHGGDWYGDGSHDGGFHGGSFHGGGGHR